MTVPVLEEFMVQEGRRETQGKGDGDAQPGRGEGQGPQRLQSNEAAQCWPGQVWGVTQVVAGSQDSGEVAGTSAQRRLLRMQPWGQLKQRKES